jgi:DNA adenine methylase
VSFFRYPGGKSKLITEIIGKLKEHNANLEYREPFFGGGSVGLEFLKGHKQKAWLNDKDVGIACLWKCVIHNKEKFKEKVMEFIPSVENFYKFKKELLGTNGMPSDDKIDEIVDIGFKKLAIHQISYSGLGTKSGGPLGGEKQQSDYKIDCRWSPAYICKKIDKLHEQFSNMNVTPDVTSTDFSDLILNEDSDSIIYLDPPYYDQGNKLYQCGFTVNDHKRLADLLSKTKHKWILSYDNCEEIRKLYNWAFIEELTVKYSIKLTKEDNRISPNKTELLIRKV